jgi:hypothetical protein
MRVNPQEMSMLVTGIANALYESLPAPELSVLAAGFVQLGDTLGTMAAQASLLQGRQGT